MFQIFRTAAIMLCLLAVVTGLGYPLAVTAVAQVVFPRAANGSLIEKAGAQSSSPSHGNARDWRTQPGAPADWVGSELVGQPFNSSKYFWSRPSSTAPSAYNSMGGSGSNQATTNPALTDTVRERVAKLRAEDPGNEAPIPVDLVTASASGLDPHLSEAAALYQISRVARARNVDAYTINKLVLSHVEKPTFGILGQSRVNVLKLNLALDSAAPVAE